MELLHCPWCGGLPIMQYVDYIGDTYFNCWKLGCLYEDCSVQPETDVVETKEEAEEIWNTRANKQEVKK